MKSFLVQFAETPIQECIDDSMIEYSDTLNLNVIKGTKIAAINLSYLATETLTKASGEGADSDQSEIHNSILMKTQTETRSRGEASDSDKETKDFQPLYGDANTNGSAR